MMMTTATRSFLAALLLATPFTMADKPQPQPDCPEALYIGYNTDSTVTKLPTSVGDAASEGWYPHDDLPQYRQHDDLPRFFLHFHHGCLTQILISAPAPEGAAASLYETQKAFAPEGVLINLKETGGVTANGVLIPDHANQAEEDGYIEGGCFSAMGGSHYSKFLGQTNDWTTLSPAVPIYDKYGTGELTAILAIFGNVFPSEGFDSQGYPVSGEFGCNLNFCSNQVCLETIGSSSFSTVHIMSYDPTDYSQWAGFQCQAPFGTCDYVTEEGLCSCCGTEANPSGIRECGSPFAEFAV